MKSITESTMLLVVLVPFQNTVATIASPRCGLVVVHGLQSKPLASILPVSPRVPLILSSVMPPADAGGGGVGGEPRACRVEMPDPLRLERRGARGQRVPDIVLDEPVRALTDQEEV